ncbi:MAG: rhodanese-like domain-containing protein [Flavobacteriaceae bacterium]|nr:rhodanese-like domain-containing protein [Flavobacteriaceae bacterium]
MKRSILLGVVALAISLQSCNNSTNGEIQMVSPVQVYEAIYGAESLQLVDVRTSEEYEVSHLKNAQNICVTSDDFREKVAVLDKEKPVYVYCKKGGRSAQAADILKEMGFTKVYDLQGGLTSWQEEGLETVN